VNIAQRTEVIVSRDFVGALLQLNAEKQISREQLIGAVEDGIQSAYRRVAGDEDIHVRIDAETGKIRVFRARRVVGEIEDEFTEMTVDQAHAIQPDAGLGDLVETEQLDGDVFGRIGAQTAKQIVLQRIREVERDQVFDQFASREGELITGTVNRVEPRAIILDVGKNVEAILATTEQSALEHYRIGQNVKAFVLEVRRSTKGPQIFVSRTHKGFLKRLFELEVPEIHSGTVQAVVAELSGEKIDVIPWNDDASLFVANALSPAQVISVDIDEEHRIASVTVPERMLSLAIGREGQNARLAARLTGWRIDIRSDVSVAEARAAADAATEPEAPEMPVEAAEPEAVAAIVAKPKRATPAARPADETAAAADTGEAPAVKPKRVTKKAAAAPEAVPVTAGASEPGDAAATETTEPEAAPAAKPKRASKKTAVPSGEVAS
jgi:N utilization substance protein A